MNAFLKNKLTIDVGNTSSKIAVFQGAEIIAFFRKRDLEVSELEAWCETYNIESIAYSASGSDSDEVIQFVQNYGQHMFLAYDCNMPIRILYKTPETLGRDRIAAVLGAVHLYPAENVLVVDLGTCVTYEILTASGDYLGGNISPGMLMRLKSMHHFTARLPLVDMAGDDFWIGNSTESALRNGAVLGTQLEIESFIGRAELFFGQLTGNYIDNCKIIFTGGDAAFMGERIEKKVLVEPNLVHKGLYELLKFNKK